jgi:hypothetical protein
MLISWLSHFFPRCRGITGMDTSRSYFFELRQKRCHFCFDVLGFSKQRIELEASKSASVAVVYVLFWSSGHCRTLIYKLLFTAIPSTKYLLSFYSEKAERAMFLKERQIDSSTNSIITVGAFSVRKLRRALKVGSVSLQSDPQTTIEGRTGTDLPLPSVTRCLVETTT